MTNDKMIEITKEEVERLFRQQQNGPKVLQIVSIIMAAVLIVTICAGTAFLKQPVYLLLLGVVVLLNILNFIFALLYDRRNIPKAMRYETVKIFNRQMNQDVCSDATVQMCMDGIRRARQYEEHAQLISYLGCIFLIRGQFGDAIQAMHSLDQTKFPSYPRTAMAYYFDLIELYYAMGDMQSVLAVYADAEAYFRMCYRKSYLNCLGMVGTLVCVHNARGEYQKALEYQLMRLDIEERFYEKSNQNPAQNTMLKQYVTGERYYNTACQYYLCGDFQNAAKYLQISTPLFGVSPYRIHCLNQLEAEIQRQQYKAD
ncbi:MAG: hypothetical protein NC089_03055 [Bacteroides sp.]|nr:hypothetical protein [Bacteroides sp.]MCM1549528.1 hypothetical protein [Clostridium sp.]